jgi:hypothetical protein
MVVPSECWYKKKNRLDQRAKFPYTYFVISSLFNLDGECLTMSYFDNLNDEFQINTKKILKIEKKSSSYSIYILMVIQILLSFDTLSMIVKILYNL